MSAPTRETYEKYADTHLDNERSTENAQGAQTAQADSSSQSDQSGLSERELAMLDFERQWWRFAGSKDEAIRAKFDVNATRYFQQLNKLLDSPEALAQDPLLVKRLRRLRDSRQKARAGRSTGMRLD